MRRRRAARQPGCRTGADATQPAPDCGAGPGAAGRAVAATSVPTPPAKRPDCHEPPVASAPDRCGTVQQPAVACDRPRPTPGGARRRAAASVLPPAPPLPPVARQRHRPRRPPTPAPAAIAAGRGAGVSEAQLSQHVLADLQRQIDLMLEVPAARGARPGAGTHRRRPDPRRPQGSDRHAARAVARSVAQELARSRRRLKAGSTRSTAGPMARCSAYRVGRTLPFGVSFRASGEGPIGYFNFKPEVLHAIQIQRDRRCGGGRCSPAPHRRRTWSSRSVTSVPPAAASRTWARTTRTAPAWRSTS